MMLQIGKTAPQFRLPASDGTIWSLKEQRGKKVVIFFYPKNMTPACTQEACDLRDRYAELQQLGVEVVGISMDTEKSHRNFIEKKELPYLLLSDTNHKVCEKYEVWQLKKLYGREYMGIVRSTFLIDEKGKLIEQWLKVKVKGHADAVLEAVKMHSKQ
ncbi:thioredoxin-dependent thiol peroxidase [Paenibacillus camelliae]|uniref:thioredoxin-dependent thiol peroxidase n=1 Tax=Paenibacillus camelliae TaxID=512410 RepID=UPI00203E529F|nr:thioredoxin-dependent thiol peroxidase [Paenibacillus camelliae]MCM3635083.1 thioredoxin-dependent thiol peroxidase [Paenibacillus camelliae]